MPRGGFGVAVHCNKIARVVCLLDYCFYFQHIDIYLPVDIVVHAGYDHFFGYQLLLPKRLHLHLIVALLELCQLDYYYYSRSKIWEVAVKKHNCICRYNNLPTTCFGLDRPSSGWDTSEENIYYKHRYGGTRSRLQIYGVCGRIGVRASMCSLGVYISWARGVGS